MFDDERKKLISDIMNGNPSLVELQQEDMVSKFIDRLIDRYVMLLKADLGGDVDLIQLTMESKGLIGDCSEIYLTWNDFSKSLHLARLKLENLGRGKLLKVGDISGDIFKFYQEGYDAGVRLRNWPMFAEHYRVARRELNILTGIPGHGKSEFMDAILVQLAEQEGWRFAIFSPENYPHAYHVEKLASKKIGKPFHEGAIERMNREDLNEVLPWIDEHFTFLWPDEDDISLEAVLNLSKKAIKEEGLDGVVIDPWNEIEHNRPDRKSETDYIGESLMKCRRFARSNDVCFWLVAHPQKMLRDKDGRRPCPSPYDVSGSAHWYNKSDNFLTVYRNGDNSVDVHIQKIKFKVRGKVGAVSFNYDKPTGIYHERTIGQIEAVSLPGAE